MCFHDDVIKWKHLLRYWPFVRRIHRSPVNSPHKGQWRGALMFSLICVWINDWVNNGESGDLRRYRIHYDVTVMCCVIPCPSSGPFHRHSARLLPSHWSNGIIAPLADKNTAHTWANISSQQQYIPCKNMCISFDGTYCVFSKLAKSAVWVLIYMHVKYLCIAASI